MYCVNCGSNLPTDAKFCINCGRAVDSNNNQTIINEPKKPAKCWSVFAKISKILGFVSFGFSFIPFYGIFAIIPAIDGIVLGALGRKALEEEAMENCKKGLTFSIIAVVLGILLFIIWMLVFINLITEY